MITGGGCLFHFLCDDFMTKNRFLIYKVTAENLINDNIKNYKNILQGLKDFLL